MKFKYIEPDDPNLIRVKLLESQNYAQGNSRALPNINCTEAFLYVIAVKDGNDVGVAGLARDGGFLEINRLYVPEIYRNKGVGRRLVEHIIEWAKDHEYSILSVQMVGFSRNFWRAVLSDYENIIGESTDFMQVKIG